MPLECIRRRTQKVQRGISITTSLGWPRSRIFCLSCVCSSAHRDMTAQLQQIQSYGRGLMRSEIGVPRALTFERFLLWAHKLVGPLSQRRNGFQHSNHIQSLCNCSTRGLFTAALLQLNSLNHHRLPAVSRDSLNYSLSWPGILLI
jgi:hypothetical protein